MKLQGPRPSNPRELRTWLENYPEWQEALEAGGLYAVDPDGTQVRSNRAGRPTESVAVYQADLSERCRVVETWLSHLPPAQRLMVQRYLRPGEVTARAISRQLQMKYGEVATMVRILPTLIYLEWYGEVDRVLNTP